MKHVLPQVIEIARSAGDAILGVYHAQGAVVVEQKADDSPLTLADQRAHDTIVAGLRRLGPNTPIVSEEGQDPVWDSTQARLGYWLVDPLDGTKEFIKRTGEFTVNIAFVVDGSPVLGVVYAPVLNTIWVGSETGAYRIDDAGEQQILTATWPTGAPPRLVASRDHAGPRVRDLLERMPAAQTLSMGSSLKFCLIAEGRADLYLRDGPTMAWDTAAAHAVVRAAGGEVYDLQRAPLRYLSPLDRNPHFVAVGDPDSPWSTLVATAEKL
jgi:3'(2'), 5'-bisphosphate nucleotidase